MAHALQGLTAAVSSAWQAVHNAVSGGAPAPSSTAASSPKAAPVDVHFSIGALPAASPPPPLSMQVHLQHTGAREKLRSLGANTHDGETACAFVTLRVAPHASNSQARSAVQRLQAQADRMLGAAGAPDAGGSRKDAALRRIQWTGPLLVGKPKAQSRDQRPGTAVDASLYEASGYRVIMLKVYWDLRTAAGAQHSGKRSAHTWQRLLPAFSMRMTCNQSLPELLSAPGHDLFTAAEVAALHKRVPLYQGPTEQPHLFPLGCTDAGQLQPPTPPSPRMPVPPLCFQGGVEAAVHSASARAAASALQEHIHKGTAHGAPLAGVLQPLLSLLRWAGGLSSFKLHPSFGALSQALDWALLNPKHTSNSTSPTSLLQRLIHWFQSPISRRAVVQGAAHHVLSALGANLGEHPAGEQQDTQDQAAGMHASAVKDLVCICSSVDTAGVQGLTAGVHCQFTGLHLPSLLEPYLATLEARPQFLKAAAPFTVAVIGQDTAAIGRLLCAAGVPASDVADWKPEAVLRSDTEFGAVHFAIGLPGPPPASASAAAPSAQAPAAVMLCLPFTADKQHMQHAAGLLRDALEAWQQPGGVPVLVAVHSCEKGGGEGGGNLRGLATQLPLHDTRIKSCGLVHVSEISGRGVASALRWLRASVLFAVL